MWATIIPVAASFLSSLFGNKSQEVQAEKNRQAELQVAQMQDERTKQAQALQESTYDPFRQPMMQMGDVAKLDWLQNANYSPTKIAAPAQYAKYVPQISGGVSYTKSPEMSQYAAMLKALIASGRAPDSVTGVTPGVVDLTGQVPVKAGSSPYNPWAAQVPVGTAVARSRVNRRYAE